MSEKQSKLAIAGSLLWLALASFVILGTHTGAVAQLGADEGGIMVPAVEMLLTPAQPGQC